MGHEHSKVKELESVNLNGAVCIVTGANAGIGKFVLFVPSNNIRLNFTGFVTARELAK